MAAAKTNQAPGAEPATQFSVFTPNRVGRLNELVGLLGGQGVHVLALTVLDTTDNSIIRFVVDDPDKARALLLENNFAFTESDLLVVEVDSAMQLGELTAALLEAEVNVHYLYSFIPHPRGKSLLAVRIEDLEVAEKVLRSRRIAVLRQADISR